MSQKWGTDPCSICNTYSAPMSCEYYCKNTVKICISCRQKIIEEYFEKLRKEPIKSVQTTSVKSLKNHNLFYVLTALSTGHKPRIEYRVSNDPNEIREIYKNETWMHDREHHMYLVEANKPYKAEMQNATRIHNADLSNVHVCERCDIFYLNKQVCNTCKDEVKSIEW